MKSYLCQRFAIFIFMQALHSSDQLPSCQVSSLFFSGQLYFCHLGSVHMYLWVRSQSIQLSVSVRSALGLFPIGFSLIVISERTVSLCAFPIFFFFVIVHSLDSQCLDGFNLRSFKLTSPPLSYQLSSVWTASLSALTSFIFSPLSWWSLCLESFTLHSSLF